MTAGKKPRLCVVGSAMVDLVSRVPRLPAPGETLVGSSFMIGFGGKGSNQAVMAARLGAAVSMVSKLGDDVFGGNTLENYRQNGIDTRQVLMDEKRPSGIATISVDETSGQNAIIIVPGANMGLSPEDIRSAADIIRSAQLVICQLEIPLETTMEAFRIARAAGVATLLNPAPATELPDELLRLSDICIPNESEARILTGIDVTDTDSAETAGRRILDRGCRTVIITLGENGALLLQDGRALHFPAQKIEAVDTTGAGDAFVGTLAYQLAGNQEMAAAVRTAVAVATQSALRQGTQSSFPYFDEVSHLFPEGGQ